MPHVVQTSDGKRSKKGLILTLIATSIFFSMISVNMGPDPDDLDYCENYVEGYPGVSYEETEECMEIRDQEASSGFVGAISGILLRSDNSRNCRHVGWYRQGQWL